MKILLTAAIAIAAFSFSASSASAQSVVLVPHRGHYHVVPTYTPPIYGGYYSGYSTPFNIGGYYSAPFGYSSFYAPSVIGSYNYGHHHHHHHNHGHHHHHRR